ncbi:MAG: hypothetical protein K0Q87_5074 [Neobacillus sp.]|jgi:hypothetical protein|nr:hypothetical protein [Neobacillus sp.]
MWIVVEVMSTGKEKFPGAYYEVYNNQKIPEVWSWIKSLSRV